MQQRHSALTFGGLAIGAALLARGLRRRRAMDFDGRTAIVTGGSRGLGLLIARELGRLGARVTIVARDQAELQRALQSLSEEGIVANTITADVTSEADAERIVTEVVTRAGSLDLLVNNAGVINVGPVEHMRVADFDEAMATHFWGPLHLMRAAIPHMKRAGEGRIVNISSIGGRVGVPHLAAYCASKFALTGLSSSLRAELARQRILVTTVCPGLMRTGSPFNASFKGRHRDEFTWFTIADSLPLISIDARRAAAQVVNAARYGDAELVITWPAKLAISAAALLPNVTAALMSVTNRMLPGPADASGDESRTGWQSTSRWAPSPLTRMTERAAAENNEIPQPHA